MSYLLPNYKRKQIEFIKGEGSYIWDTNNKKYLDFTSGIGVQNLGHRPKSVETAVKKQVETMWHIPNLYQNSKQETVAKLLGDGYDYLAFFCNSGAEANEAAIKLAKKASGKSKIVSFKQSFHGRTYGAMSATGQESIHQGFQPLVPGFSYLNYNSFEDLNSLDDSIGAVILELVQGEGGVIPADEKWIQTLAKTCRELGILIIVDEIQTGIGRTGTFFAFEQYGLFPDIVSLAKGLGNGIPVGAILAKEKLAGSFGPGSHGTTFGGNLLAMSAAEIIVETVRDIDFLEEVQVKSAHFFNSLDKLKSLDIVVDVRGKGLMIGIQVPANKVVSIIDECEKKGLAVLRAGDDVIRLLPPLTISMAEIDAGLTILTDVLEAQNGK